MRKSAGVCVQNTVGSWIVWSKGLWSETFSNGFLGENSVRLASQNAFAASNRFFRNHCAQHKPYFGA